MLYDEQIHYDPVGNVAAVTTVLPAGTDNQLFCYDEQNRLTWAGTTTGNPCGNSGATGSFGGASYTQSFSYDPLNRLTSSPLGSYIYGDSAHLHAATSVSSGSSQYTASYDASGDMQCRAPSSSTTCSGTQTGQQLTWDVEGRLATWQNTTTNPTITAKYLYDGEGNRVVQQVVDSTAGSTTTTSYIGSLETHTQTLVSGGPGTISATDYIPAGKVLAVASNGTLSYLATSYQGSIVEALDSTGTVGVTASQLYAPYGGVRYSSGTMPTDYGYTGQRADASTGLDYYGARYYDPTLGQFTSADTVLDGGGLSICGLNRYAYVKDNPDTLVDPSGNCPQKAQTGWKTRIKAAAYVIAHSGLLIGQGILPTSQARNAQSVYGPASNDSQVENTNVLKRPTAGTGADDDCGDDRGIRVPSTWAIIVRSAGKIVATVTWAGKTVQWNHQDRKNPKQKEQEAQEPEASAQSKQKEAEARYRQRTMDLNMNEVRAGPEPFQQRLVALNETGPVDPSYVPWDPSTWTPVRPTWWSVATVAGVTGAAVAVDGAGGYDFPPVGGYGGASGEHL